MQQRSKSHSTPVRAPSDNVSQRVGNNNNPSNNVTSSTNSNNNNSNGPPVVNTETQQVIKGLEWVLGLSIRVKTLNDEEYEGQIYAYDPKTNCVVLHILFTNFLIYCRIFNPF
ncbi:hypothetical protein Glove_26g176 [Diversispora epigaea]|uniref:LSM domain-containing protein n=1 Tax=Diversispora epigaea TaxID=1348612 RepID=A0A397JJ21_9GLOM|nr:hypothetical protein Glove_26g176 [Diversispora epigaea]